MLEKFTVSKSVFGNIFASLGVQLVLIIVSVLLTDGGATLQLVTYGVGINAILTLLIVLRRGRLATRGDLVALRYGFF